MFNKLPLQSTLILLILSYLGISVHGAEEKRQFQSSYTYDGWEIISNESNEHNNEINKNEEDFWLKATAFGNTALTVLGGAGMTIINEGINIIEQRIKDNARQVDSTIAFGSQLVGTLYGEGLALRQAYENEKEILKENK